jgi:hypothetical protein
VGKEAWRRASPVLQKNILETSIPMLGKIDERITAINTLHIYA